MNEKTFLTWLYNEHGHIELWEGAVHPHLVDRESDLYLQDGGDVEGFTEMYGLEVSMLVIGHWNHEEDQGYFL